MARLSDNRIAFLYTADDGTVYRVAAVKAYTDQAKQGGAAYVSGNAPKPASIKMRRITVRTAGGESRVIPVYSTDAAINTPGETINLNLGSDSASFVSDGNPIPQGHIRSNVTRQTT